MSLKDVLEGQAEEVAKTGADLGDKGSSTPSQNIPVQKLSTSAANFDLLTGVGDRWPLDVRLPSLQESGVSQLYPDDYELVGEMKKLGRSLLLNFLELITIMGSSPEEFPEKLEHIRIIMLNMHHLINLHRPQQTRASLIALMEEQLARRTKGTEEIEAATAATKLVLERYRNFSVPMPMKVEQITANGHPDSPSVVTTTEDLAKSEDLHLFDMLNTIVT